MEWKSAHDQMIGPRKEDLDKWRRVHGGGELNWNRTGIQIDEGKRALKARR